MNTDAPTIAVKDTDWLNDSITALRNARGKLGRARSEATRNRLTSKISNLEKEIGRELLERGQYEEGLCYYRTLSEKETDEDICIGLSLALCELNRYAEAKELLDRSLKSYPDSAPLLLNMGNYYHQQDNFEKSLEYYEMARLVDPEDEAYQISCGNALFGLACYDDACDIYVSLLEKCGSFPSPIYQIQLGYCNLNTGFSKVAAEFFKAALENENADPDSACINADAVLIRNADAYNGLFCAYNDMGLKDEAVNTLLEGLSTYPKQHSGLYHNLGIFYADMDWLSGAIDVVRRGLDIFPEDEDLISLLNALDEGDDDPDRDVKPPVKPRLLVLV